MSRHGRLDGHNRALLAATRVLIGTRRPIALSQQVDQLLNQIDQQGPQCHMLNYDFQLENSILQNVQDRKEDQNRQLEEMIAKCLREDMKVPLRVSRHVISKFRLGHRTDDTPQQILEKAKDECVELLAPLIEN
mmetsp:Transcript_18121/g.29403  ORF Transcript_18121/g.29403 Transcript_18121/m.29403 type:complete len:134 (-) Transcript_18121:896-1297(-)